MIEEFMGFPRPKGQVGIRNKIVILPSVVCVNHVAQQIHTRSDTPLYSGSVLGIATWDIPILGTYAPTISGRLVSEYGVIDFAVAL